MVAAASRRQKERRSVRSFIVTLCRERSDRLCYFLCALTATVFASIRIASYKVNNKDLLKAPINDIERECPAPKYPVVGQNISSTARRKICMTTLTDASQADWFQRLVRWRNFNNLLDLTWPNKQRYCEKHGYQLFNESHSLDKSRPPSWSKIRAAQRLLTEEDCEYVLWLDADTVIMNSAKSIEDYFLPTPETGIDLVITQQKGQSWNAGAWLIRNSEWSRHFLDHWWNMKDFVKPKGLAVSGDNDALKAYLSSMDPDEFAQHIAVPPRCLFNSEAKWVQRGDPPVDTIAKMNEMRWYLRDAPYHKGDFVVHVAGVDNKIATTELLLKDAV